MAEKASGRSMWWLPAVVLLAAAVGAHGQGNAGQDGAGAQIDASVKLPVYDVVSIKPNKSGSGSMNVDSTKGRYLASNVSLKIILENAYDVRQDLITGLPEPIASARFDIEAKVVDPEPDAPAKLSGKELGMMLLPILAERFQLKAHTEIKTLPVYELVVAPGGSKLKPSPAESKRGGSMGMHGDSKSVTMTAHDLPLVSLAKALANQVHRTVIDKTELAGNYDFELKWTPDDGPGAEGDGGPGLFTALQEQLGVKLQAGKGPVESLVVDHVEMPSEN